MSADNLTQTVWQRQGTQEGAEVRFLCPAHDDTHPSARWNPEKGVWHCDACNAGGGAKDLAEHLNLASTTPAPKPKSKIIATYDYVDADGPLLFQALRLEPKSFRQRQPKGDGWEWNLKGVTPVLYRYPKILEAVQDGETVCIVEGEKDVHTLETLGMTATCNPMGAGKWRDSYSAALSGAHVVLLPDNDEAGTDHARKVAHSLQNKVKSLRIVKLPGLEPKGDVSDWVATGKTAEDLNALVDEAEVWTPEGDTSFDAFVNSQLGDAPQTHDDNGDDDDKGNDAKEKQSHADALIKLGLEHTLDFFHADEVAYASVRKGDYIEHYRVNSKKYQSFLTHAFYKTRNRAPSKDAVQTAVNFLEAKALFDYEAREVFVRTARYGDRLYLDLADGEGRVVEITRDGWHLTKEPPVAFLRPKGMRGLPVPVEGGDVTLLRKFVKVTDNDFALLLGFLVGCLLHGTPYPLLILIAEQGSGKSTLARIIKRLIDPNAAPVRSDPREARDLMISATHSLLLAFDNLSSIATWFSDAICRLSTGGGFATRTLYANEEETIFDAMRPCILTGIDELASRSDLLDRAIILNLLRITPEERVTDAELWQAFDKAAPHILGGLLDAVSAGLRDHPHVKLETLPRMADFAKWVVACEGALGLEPGVFMRAYLQNRATANEVALDVSPVPQELRKLVTKHGGAYVGTASDLLTDLDALASEKTMRQKAWPKNARTLGSTLRRLAPNLRETGVEIDFIREGGSGRRVVSIKMQNDVTNVTDVTRPEESPTGTRTDNVTTSVTSNAAPESDVTPMSQEKVREARQSDDRDICDNEMHLPSESPTDHLIGATRGEI